MNIGEKITSLRQYHDLSQKELAEKIGINRSVLNRIELGTRPVRDDELYAISRFFNVSADLLIGKISLEKGLMGSENELRPKATSNNITVNGNNGATSGSGSATSNSYYYDEEVAELADRMKNQPGMRILFDAAKDVSKEDLETVAKMMEGLKKTRRQD